MVQPRVLHPNIQLTDITDIFIESSSKIPTGQLLKDEGFTLFEAVGALEIGDPKMDSGALEEGEDLEDDFDVSQPLSPEQVIWIIDQLIYREVSWQQGYPLSQTLFTSIHLDKILWPDPKNLTDAHFIRSADANPSTAWSHEFLRAYCLGVVKCVDLVLSMVTSQHYYEEEDFATQVFNREMLRRFPVDEVLAAMTRARKNFEDAAPTTQHHDELLERLVFRIDFLEVLSEASHGTHSPEKVDKLVDLLKGNRESCALGVALPDAFSIKVQRRLATSVPPRPMLACGSDEAFSFLDRLLRDIPTAFEMLQVTGATDLHTAFWTFMSQEPTPCIYVRSVVQAFLNLDDQMLGRYALNEYIADDLRALVLPASILLGSPVENPADPRFRIWTQVTQFIGKVAPSFQNQFRSFALNRSRVRRNLCHAAIEWDNIQADAEEIDGYLQTLTHERPLPYGQSDEPAYAFPLSSWVYHYKLLQLRLVIQTGFELEVYANAEYVEMYWYLGHMAGLHLSHLERMSYFISQAKPLPNWSTDDHRHESQKALHLLYRHFSWIKATDTLASALQRVFVVLARHGHPRKHDIAYASNELRHEVRMRPFQHLSVPEPIPHDEMKMLARLESLPDREVLDQAARLVLASRKAWDQVLKDQWNGQPVTANEASQKPSILQREWTTNVKNSMKACIGTSIAITTLTKVVSEAEAAKKHDKASKDAVAALKVIVPGVDDPARFHKWWAVPSVMK